MMMSNRWCMGGLVLAGVLLLRPLTACCPAPRIGQPVVNADQTVVIIWDAKAKMQHFIRQASFRSQGEDFGFLVPTPSQPELEESGNDAFPHLLKLTEPERIKQKRPSNVNISCGCSKTVSKDAGVTGAVAVLQEKRVAGFDAVVLEASSSTALVGWLKEHAYAFSPQVEAWAKPYVDAGWKITALKVAKDMTAKEQQQVMADSLRLSFQTDRPLFPYREPESTEAAAALGVKERLLRIYFIAEARYQGELTKESPWTGKVAWAGPVGDADRRQLLQELKLPENTGPAEWWLTEFEDRWPYRVAPGDVYFARDADQSQVRRLPIIEYVDSGWPGDVMVYGFAVALLLCRYGYGGITMMSNRWCVVGLVLAGVLMLRPLTACCPAPILGQPVVNADQTVVIIWDAKAKMQHFIRQASFRSQGEDFGFLVPTPSQPELEESGKDAFPQLLKLTEPERIKQKRPSGGFISCGCGASPPMASAPPPVIVLQEKRVAGFDAVVLEASSSTALVGWLKEHGYAFSPQVEAWAKPYVDAGWKITALKVAKDMTAKEQQQVMADSLRLSFQTDRPLFPYREPESTQDAAALGVKDRLLRIYFIAEARYQGELTKESPWTGKAAWAGKVASADRQKLLQALRLPDNTGPADWWLTEFEDRWPYRVAPGDVYFTRDADQSQVRRLPTIEYVDSGWPGDVMVYGFAVALLLSRSCRHYWLTCH